MRSTGWEIASGERVYTLRIRKLGGNEADEQEVIVDKNRVEGCAFSVESLGTYNITFQSVLPGLAGSLHHNWNLSFGADIEGDNFFQIVDDDLATPTPWATGSPAATPTVPQTLPVTDTPPETEAATATETPIATQTLAVTETPMATEKLAVTDTPTATEAPTATETLTPAPTPTATGTSGFTVSVKYPDFPRRFRLTYGMFVFLCPF
jgi:hypothetical protein